RRRERGGLISAGAEPALRHQGICVSVSPLSTGLLVELSRERAQEGFRLRCIVRATLHPVRAWERFVSAGRFISITPSKSVGSQSWLCDSNASFCSVFVE